MTTQLKWKREAPSGDNLGQCIDLRKAIKAAYGLPMTFNGDDIQERAFLRGLAALGLDGAEELLEAVESNDRVTVWEES